MRTRSLGLALFAGLTLMVSACSSAATPAPASVAPTTAASPSAPASAGSAPASAPASAASTLKIGMVTDVGTLDDKSFNEATWAGTQDGAAAIGAPAPRTS